VFPHGHAFLVHLVALGCAMNMPKKKKKRNSGPKARRE
jgi:hypothetical protein